MATLRIRNSTHTPTPVVLGHWFTFTPTRRCYISIGPSAIGDATQDTRSAELQPGLTYQYFVPSGVPMFLDGLATRAAADTTPDTVTFTDVGIAPILLSAQVQVGG